MRNENTCTWYVEKGTQSSDDSIHPVLEMNLWCGSMLLWLNLIDSSPVTCQNSAKNNWKALGFGRHWSLFQGCGWMSLLHRVTFNCLFSVSVKVKIEVITSALAPLSSSLYIHRATNNNSLHWLCMTRSLSSIAKKLNRRIVESLVNK